MNLADMMSYQLAFFKNDAEEKGLTLALDASIEGAEALIVTDRTKLEDILSNLLNNALKFTHTGGVSFGNSLQDGHLLFYVRDTGIGIEPTKLDLIFQRFAQADLSSTRPYEGAGLGLSIVKAYVDKMDGHLWVESVPGEGSTFYVQLPYVPVEQMPQKKVEQAEPLLKAETPVTILVAEDDETSFQYLEIILSLEGAVVLRVTNGEDAVKMVKEHPEINLVLMDVKMPGMNGLEATRHIRTFNPVIPIIAQTAFAFDKDKDEAMLAGCTDFLAKPVKRQHLLAHIRQYVKRRTQ
jgi:CheY-like chemotaxis protein/anti-sigma regulatory factor (Ser/Thr protein kinase)